VAARQARAIVDPECGTLVDLLDRLVSLYGPTFASLLQEKPEAFGIRGFIGRQEPTALLKDDEGRGYRDDAFVEKANALLRQLVGETSEIAASIRMPRRNPLHLHADIDRRDNGRTYFRATIADGYGSVFARRTAMVFENHGHGFLCGPAEIGILAFSEHPEELENVVLAARSGLGKAMDFMIEADLVHVQKGARSIIVRRFAESFPTDGRAYVSRVETAALWLMANSTQQPYKFFVTPEAREELEGGAFAEADFETLPSVEIGARLIH